MSKRRKHLLSRLIRYEKKRLKPVTMRRLFKAGARLLSLLKKEKTFSINGLVKKLNPWLDSDPFAHSSMKFSAELTHWLKSFFYLPDCSIKGKRVYSGWYYIEFSKKYKKFAKRDACKALTFRNLFYLWHMKKRLTKRLVRIIKRKTRKPVFKVKHLAKQSNNLFILRSFYSFFLPINDAHFILAIRLVAKLKKILPATLPHRDRQALFFFNFLPCSIQFFSSLLLISLPKLTRWLALKKKMQETLSNCSLLEGANSILSLGCLSYQKNLWTF